ncbi:hypothetical protein NDU88_008739 [Pleurodeles waltl]|uniref:Neurotransmitter-gated ion-channel ligand-binding domain-containing protein n=1 Tax=Pleurodeles waltl TaxID=8319 RepID=A0AAV7NWZ8_PLEWA|nr:hypothetical protein NDU88_008739 [Pleurodeles waltl]
MFGCLGAQGKYAYKLMKDLFANYSNALRPVEDMDKSMNVTLQITLSQIIDMVSVERRVRDLSGQKKDTSVFNFKSFLTC